MAKARERKLKPKTRDDALDEAHGVVERAVARGAMDAARAVVPALRKIGVETSARKIADIFAAGAYGAVESIVLGAVLTPYYHKEAGT